MDEIIHLGDYWDEEGITRYKAAILQQNQEIGRLETFYVPNMDFEAINNLRNKTLTRILGCLKDCEV